MQSSRILVTSVKTFGIISDRFVHGSPLIEVLKLGSKKAYICPNNNNFVPRRAILTLLRNVKSDLRQIIGENSWLA